MGSIVGLGVGPRVGKGVGNGVDGCNETATRALMGIDHARARTARPLQRYEDLGRRLAADLHVSASAQTRGLAEDIRGATAVVAEPLVTYASAVPSMNLIDALAAAPVDTVSS